MSTHTNHMNAMPVLNGNSTLQHMYSIGIDELMIQHWDTFEDADVIIVKSNLTQDIVFGYLWWALITVISLHNCWTIMVYWRQRLAIKLNVFQIKMLYLSTIYVIVCAIRGIWPRKDVDRICFFDRTISTVFFGRSAATVAELCFVKQLSLVLGEIINKYQFGLKSTYFMAGYQWYVPFVSIAEICSWIGIATKIQLWNAFEESIWMVTGLHMTISYIILYRSKKSPRPTVTDKRHFAMFIIAGLLFVSFMCLIDIPMYLERFYYDTYVNDVDYLWLSEGIMETMTCQQIVHDFSIWWEDIPWMTGYFSVGVWISMYFINMPIIDHIEDELIGLNLKPKKL